MRSNLDYKKYTNSVIGQSNCDELTNTETDRQSTKRSFVKEPYARKTILKTTKDINSKATGKLFKEVSSQNSIFNKAPSKINSNTNFAKYTQQADPKGRNSRTNNPRQYQLKKDSSDKNFSKILKANQSTMSSKLKGKNPNISDSKDSDVASPVKQSKPIGCKTSRGIEIESPTGAESPVSEPAQEILGVLDNINNIVALSIANSDLFKAKLDAEREIVNEDITYCLSPSNKPRFKDVKSSKNVVKSDKAGKSTKRISKFNTCKNIDKIALDRNLVFNKICYDIDELQNNILEIVEKYERWDNGQKGRYNTLNCPSALNSSSNLGSSNMKSIYLSSEKRICVYRDIIKNCSRTLTEILSLINDDSKKANPDEADKANLFNISEGKQNESNKSVLINSFNSATSLDKSTDKDRSTNRKLSIQNLIDKELAIEGDKLADAITTRQIPTLENKDDPDDSGYENLEESLDYGHKSNLNENVKANKPYVQKMVVCKHKDAFIRSFQDELITMREQVKSNDNSFEHHPYSKSKQRLKMKRSKSEIFTKNTIKSNNGKIIRAKHSSKRVLNLYGSHGIITSDSEDKSSEDTLILFPNMQASDLEGLKIDLTEKKEKSKSKEKSPQAIRQVETSGGKCNRNRERGQSFNEERLNTIENMDVNKPKMVRDCNFRE